MQPGTEDVWETTVKENVSPFPLHPGSHRQEGTPVALLQFPNPHDLVSGAVIHASQAEDALAVVVLVGLMFKLQVEKRPR